MTATGTFTVVYYSVPERLVVLRGRVGLSGLIEMMRETGLGLIFPHFTLEVVR